MRDQSPQAETIAVDGRPAFVVRTYATNRSGAFFRIRDSFHNEEGRHVLYLNRAGKWDADDELDEGNEWDTAEAAHEFIRSLATPAPPASQVELPTGPGVWERDGTPVIVDWRHKRATFMSGTICALDGLTPGGWRQLTAASDLEREVDTDPDQILAMAGSHWVDEETKRVIATLTAERDEARARLLTAAGDDLCRLSQEEIKAMSAGEVKIPPKEEFLASCERFHAQVANEVGVNSNCLTLAQLVAESERLRRENADLNRLLTAAEQQVKDWQAKCDELGRELHAIRIDGRLSAALAAAESRLAEAEKRSKEQGRSLGLLAPKGTWLCEVLENIWRTESDDERTRFALAAQKVIAGDERLYVGDRIHQRATAAESQIASVRGALADEGGDVLAQREDGDYGASVREIVRQRDNLSFLIRDTAANVLSDPEIMSETPDAAADKLIAGWDAMGEREAALRGALEKAILWAITIDGIGAPEDRHVVFDLQESGVCSREQAEEIVASIKAKYPHAIVATSAPPAPSKETPNG